MKKIILTISNALIVGVAVLIVASELAPTVMKVYNLNIPDLDDSNKN